MPIVTIVKPLALELDVYNCILEKMAESGQSASDVLRNHLGFSPPRADSSTSSSTDALGELLTSSRFRYARGVVGKFLVVLAWLYSRHRKEFEVVENIKGRGRLYFAKSERPLNESGESVNPKPIPNSPYWVITTSPTNLKLEMLARVMSALGYSTTDIRRVESVIARTAT